MLGSSMSWYNRAGDEEILWKSNPSYVKALPFLLFGLVFSFLAGMIALYLYFFTELPELVAYGTAILIPFGIIFSGMRMLKFKNTMYVITTRRVIIKEDIVGKSTSSIPHREVQRTDVHQSNMNALISRVTSESIGDLMMYTADDEGGEFKLGNVPELDLAEQYAERLSGSNLSTHGAEKIDRAVSDGEQKQRNNHHSGTSVDSENRRNHEDTEQYSGDSDEMKSDAGRRDSSSPQRESENSMQSDEDFDTEDTDSLSDDFDEYTPSDKA